MKTHAARIFGMTFFSLVAACSAGDRSSDPARPEAPKADDPDGGDGGPPGWSRLHPFVTPAPLSQPLSLDGKLWLLQEGRLLQFTNGAFEEIDVPGVDTVDRIKLSADSESLALIGDDRRIRVFTPSSGWLELADAPADVRDIAAANDQTVWLAGKWNLYQGDGSAWQKESDFPGWGTINNLGWRNEVEVSADGHVWTTNDYWSSDPHFSHFDGADWEELEGMASQILPLADGEALVEFFGTSLRYVSTDGGEPLLSTRDWKANVLPDGLTPTIRGYQQVGDEIWVVTRKQALHFDGSTWSEIELPQVHEPGFRGVLVHDGKATIVGEMGVFRVTGGVATWASEKRALTLAYLENVTSLSDGGFALAGRGASIVEVSAAGSVEIDALPIDAWVERVVSSADGALWAVAGTETVDAQSVIRSESTLWRRDAQGWGLVHTFDSGDVWRDLRSFESGGEGSVLLSFGNRIMEIDSTGQLNMDESVGGSTQKIRVARFEDTTWVASSAQLWRKQAGGDLEEIEFPQTDRPRRFTSLSEIGPEQAIVYDERSESYWFIDEEVVAEVAPPLEATALALDGSGRWLSDGNSILEFSSGSFVPLVELSPEWNAHSCAKSEVRILCVGNDGEVLSHPLP